MINRAVRMPRPSAGCASTIRVIGRSASPSWVMICTVKQPVCEAIRQEELNFILVCKPDSHKTLYEWVAGLETTGGEQRQHARARGR